MITLRILTPLVNTTVGPDFVVSGIYDPAANMTIDTCTATDAAGTTFTGTVCGLPVGMNWARSFTGLAVGWATIRVEARNQATLERQVNVQPIDVVSVTPVPGGAPPARQPMARQPMARQPMARPTAMVRTASAKAKKKTNVKKPDGKKAKTATKRPMPKAKKPTPRGKKPAKKKKRR